MDHLPLCFGLLFLTCHKDYSVSFDLVTHFERGVLARGSFKKSAAENSHLMTCPIAIVFDFFCVRCQLALSIAEPALRRTATRFIHIIVDRCFDGFVDDVFSLFRIDFLGLPVYAGYQLFHHHWVIKALGEIIEVLNLHIPLSELFDEIQVGLVLKFFELKVY